MILHSLNFWILYGLEINPDPKYTIWVYPLETVFLLRFSIYLFLKERTEYAILNNIKKEKIIIDPGIGFGKRTGKGIEDNCEILSNLSKLKLLKFPIMVGVSRKTFIGNICGINKSLKINERLEGSLAAAGIAVINGADLIRTHDVKETRRFLNLIDFVIKNK